MLLHKFYVVSSLAVTLAACGTSENSLSWHNDYALSYTLSSAADVRLQSRGEWVEDAISMQLSGSGDFLGTGLGWAEKSSATLFGYTQGDKLKLFRGIAFRSDELPDDELPNVASAPAITHVEADSWLVAYRKKGWREGIEVRPYSNTFGSPLDFSTVVNRNVGVQNAPAMAYFNGRLVIVWGRSEVSQDFSFVAGDYQPGDSEITIAQEGRIPPARGVDPDDLSWGAELGTNPALTHDGRGKFYLAIVRKKGIGGPFSKDYVDIYSSEDGRSWAQLTYPLGDAGNFPTATGHVSIAAKPNGEVLLAIVRVPYRGRLFLLRNGAWNELPNAPLQWPEFTGPPRLVRSSYLD